MWRCTQQLYMYKHAVQLLNYTPLRAECVVASGVTHCTAQFSRCNLEVHPGLSADVPAAVPSVTRQLNKVWVCKVWCTIHVIMSDRPDSMLFLVW